MLEVATGTGQHISHFAAALPSLQWQPTDVSDEGFDSIRAYTVQLSKVLPPLVLDASLPPEWPVKGPCAAVLAANVTHISPWWVVCQWLCSRLDCFLTFPLSVLIQSSWSHLPDREEFLCAFNDVTAAVINEACCRLASAKGSGKHLLQLHVEWLSNFDGLNPYRALDTLITAGVHHVDSIPTLSTSVQQQCRVPHQMQSWAKPLSVLPCLVGG